MNEKVLVLIALLFSFLFFIGCGNHKKTKPDLASGQENRSGTGFVLPRIPEDLTDPKARTDYLITHYWDHFDFTDTTHLLIPEILEPAIVHYLDLFLLTDRHTYSTALKNTLDKSKAQSKTYRYFTQTFTKYLYDAASPIRNDEIYICFLKYMLNDPSTPATDREQALYRLEKASLNRIDSIATDFQYALQDGRSSSLHALESTYILIFFYYPDCAVCKEHIQELNTSAIINTYLENKLLTILAFYPDKHTDLWKQHSSILPSSWINSYDKRGIVESEGLYDIKASPTLYLLDKNKKVILKDTGIDKVEEYLYENRPAFME